MLTCRKCKTNWTFDRVDPVIDDAGCFFACPVCGQRNPLMNVGRGEDLVLVQPQFDPPPAPPK